MPRQDLRIRQWNTTTGYSPRISSEQWEAYRDILERLHLEGKSRAEMLAILDQDHDFRPTLYQLNARMTDWRLHRYRTQASSSADPSPASSSQSSNELRQPGDSGRSPPIVSPLSEIATSSQLSRTESIHGNSNRPRAPSQTTTSPPTEARLTAPYSVFDNPFDADAPPVPLDPNQSDIILLVEQTASLTDEDKMSVLNDAAEYLLVTRSYSAAFKLYEKCYQYMETSDQYCPSALLSGMIDCLRSFAHYGQRARTIAMDERIMACLTMLAARDTTGFWSAIQLEVRQQQVFHPAYCIQNSIINIHASSPFWSDRTHTQPHGHFLCCCDDVWTDNSDSSCISSLLDTTYFQDHNVLRRLVAWCRDRVGLLELSSHPFSSDLDVTTDEFVESGAAAVISHFVAVGLSDNESFFEEQILADLGNGKAMTLKSIIRRIGGLAFFTMRRIRSSAAASKDVGQPRIASKVLWHDSLRHVFHELLGCVENWSSQYVQEVRLLCTASYEFRKQVTGRPQIEPIKKTALLVAQTSIRKKLSPGRRRSAQRSTRSGSQRQGHTPSDGTTETLLASMESRSSRASSTYRSFRQYAGRLNTAIRMPSTASSMSLSPGNYTTSSHESWNLSNFLPSPGAGTLAVVPDEMEID